MVNNHLQQSDSRPEKSSSSLLLQSHPFPSSSTSSSSSSSSDSLPTHHHQHPSNLSKTSHSNRILHLLRSHLPHPHRWSQLVNSLDLPTKIDQLPKSVRLSVPIIIAFCLLTIIIDGWSHHQLNHLRFPWTLSTYTSQLSSTHSTSWTTIMNSYSGLPACDPFSEPGSVVFNESFYNDANWVPYSSTCPPCPDYLSSLRNIRSISKDLSLKQRTRFISLPIKPTPQLDAQAGESRDQFDLWGRPYPSLNFLHGKTILYLGDSVDRNALEHLYQLLGANVRSLSYNDINSEPTPDWDRRSTPWEIDLGLIHPRNRNQSLAFNNNRPDGEFGGLNCRFVNGFFYGLDDIDEFSAQGDWHPPGLVEKRIEELVYPMTSQFASETPTHEGPAFISLQSGLWDLAFFGRRNRQTNTTIDSPLKPEQLNWYLTRFQSLIKAVKSRYPNTPIWIRMTHRVGDQFWASHDWQAGLKNGLGEGFVNFFSDVRIHQIRQVQQYVARLEGLPIFDFGKIWEGYQKHQDKVHPLKIPGGVLMNQAILHHVWMESIGRKNWDPRLKIGLGPLPHQI